MPMVARGPRPSFAGDDPLSVILRPPADESHMQRSERIKREAEAKRVNDEIDKRLKEDAQRLKKERQGEHKILLLGE